MNRKNRCSSAKKKDPRRMLASVHIMIAIVALLECIILISFTTFSWIESASSLIIETGKQSIEAEQVALVDIAKVLDSEVTLTTETRESIADLSTYYSKVDYFRFSKASSPDGVSFYFPRKNNTDVSATAYRAGDTTDINTSYTYFDFIINNTYLKLNFFFDNADVFTVTDAGTLTSDQQNAVKNAMRLSIQSGSGTAAIYSNTETTYNAVSTTAGASGTMVSITTHAINTTDKIFASAKNSHQKISVRIWLEDQDPGFVSAFGSAFSATNPTEDQTALLSALYGCKVRINLNLKNGENAFSTVDFDDYTFSNTSTNLGGHVTQDNENYRVYFACETTGGVMKYFPMAISSPGSGNNPTRWSTVNAAGSFDTTINDSIITKLADDPTDDDSGHYENSYFGYGALALGDSTYATAPTPNTELYKWELPDAPDDNYDLLFDAYSLNTVSSTPTYEGAGQWNANDSMTLVYFRDLATGFGSSSFESNEGYITNATITSETTRKPVMYLNASASAGEAAVTSSMYYDGSVNMFKCYVPTSWLANTVYFHYIDAGIYSSSTPVNITWAAATPSNSAYSQYRYTAFGYTDQAIVSTTSTAGKTGAGTWDSVMETPIRFTAEMLDTLINGNYRFEVSTDSGSTWYGLANDGSSLRYYAYVPAEKSGDLEGNYHFRCVSAYNSETVVGYWYAGKRLGSYTFYPVDVKSSVTTTDPTRGYWHVSVLVDGTYENLIYDTITNTYSFKVTESSTTTTYTNAVGTLKYSVDNGATFTAIPAANALDHYRWYIPAQSGDTVYSTIVYRWTPYLEYTTDPGGTTVPGTYFDYIHSNPSLNPYFIVTEGGAEASG